MGHRAAGILAAFLLSAALAGVPVAADVVTARWSLEGSDLAIWRVFLPPTAEGGAETARPPDLSLGLFGYQLDRKGRAHFPVHTVEEIAYDLALRVPLGRVKKGDQLRTAIRYDGIRDHRPMDVAISGKVVEVSGDTFRLEGKAVGSPAARFNRVLQGSKKWLTEVSGEFETVFDVSRGVMVSSSVRLRTSSVLTEEARRDPNAPAPTSTTHHFRFQLRGVRKYDPRWVDISFMLNSAVGQAIAKGTGWLRDQVEADGTYPVHQVKYIHGETCLVALTLLVCGAERDDPFILGLMEKIRSFQPKNTYELAVALMAMEAFYAPADEVAEVHAGRRSVPLRRKVEKEDLRWMQEQTDRLISFARRQKAGWGWTYNDLDTRPIDLSNTQYAALGLLSAWRCGVRIPEEAWVEIGKGVLRHQHGTEKQVTGTRARGFSYYPRAKEVKSSMTGGGISTLQIAREVMAANKSRFLKGGMAKKMDTAIEEGWAWMGRHWVIQRHAPDFGRGWLLYSLYSLERAAVLCHVKRLNGRDWYFEGAAWLVGTQEADGHWQDGSAGIHNTCFALLFLKRGTIPVTTGGGK